MENNVGKVETPVTDEAVQPTETADMQEDAEVNEILRRAANAGVTLSTEGAMDEIAADLTEHIMTDEQALRDFVNHTSRDQKKRTMGQKFFQAVREFINKVKRIFKGDRKTMDQAAQDAFGATVEQLEKAEQLWQEAYRAAEKNAEEQKTKTPLRRTAKSMRKRQTDFGIP